MERPFVVCHMLASLDGKIDGAFFGAPQTAPALQVYGDLRGFYGCQTTLYGTTTMLGGYADGKVSPLSANGKGAAQRELGGTRRARRWAISSSRWTLRGNWLIPAPPSKRKAAPRPCDRGVGRSRRPRPTLPIYRRGAFLFICRIERLDCALLLQKLYRQFGIDKLMLAGGGIVTDHFWLRAWWTSSAWWSLRWPTAAAAWPPLPRRTFCPTGPRRPFI